MIFFIFCVEFFSTILKKHMVIGQVIREIYD